MEVGAHVWPPLALAASWSLTIMKAWPPRPIATASMSPSVVSGPTPTCCHSLGAADAAPPALSASANAVAETTPHFPILLPTFGRVSERRGEMSIGSEGLVEAVVAPLGPHTHRLVQTRRSIVVSVDAERCTPHAGIKELGERRQEQRAAETA